MKLSLAYNDFQRYIITQLNHFFPDENQIKDASFQRAFDQAIERTRYCFSFVSLPAYSLNNQPFLNHLHSDQYAVFLWFLSSTIWNESRDGQLANKLFGLNKALHGFSCMYDTRLPDVFLLLHTVGTVLGKAEYGNFFAVAHGCTVGAQSGKYPRIGKGVAMLTHSSIIGDCSIGKLASIGINSVVYKTDVPANHNVYVNQEGKVMIRESLSPWIYNVFDKEAMDKIID